MINANITPDGDWIDAQGNKIAPANVKDEDKLEDELVREHVGEAIDLNKALTAFYDKAFTNAAAFRQIVNDKYGVKRGGKKGNMTLRTYDGRFEMSVQISESIAFGPALQAAKELVDECVKLWVVGANDNLRIIVMDAFQVDKEGRINTGRILGLRRFNVSGPGADEWQRAMDAIAEAVRVVGSKTKLYFRQRRENSDAMVTIPLNLAAIAGG